MLQKRRQLEKRRHKRYVREFVVKIANKSYLGHDLSEGGFSIRLKAEETPMFVGQRMIYAQIEGDAGNAYSIKEIAVKSRAQLNDWITYGFSIERIEKDAEIKHRIAISGLHETESVRHKIPARILGESERPSYIEIHANVVNALAKVATDKNLAADDARAKIAKYLEMIKTAHNI